MLVAGGGVTGTPGKETEEARDRGPLDVSIEDEEALSCEILARTVPGGGVPPGVAALSRKGEGDAADVAIRHYNVDVDVFSLDAKRSLCLSSSTAACRDY